MRVIAVIGQQRRTTTTQRAIHEQFDAAHFQPATGVLVGPVRAQIGQRLAVAIGIGVDAQWQPPGIGEAAHQGQIGARYAHVVHAGQALADRFIQRAGQHLLAGGLARRRDRGLHQRHRFIDKHPARLALGIARDASTRRLPVALQRALPRLPGYRAQCRAVGPAGVTIDTAQPDRPVREGAVEVGHGRELLVRPAVLVPAAPQQPALGVVRRKALQARHDVRGAGGAGQIGLHQRAAEEHQMGMCVDQARDHRGLADVGQRRQWIQLEHRLPVADGEHAPGVGVPGQRCGCRRVRIARMDGSGGQQADIGLRGPGQQAGHQGSESSRTHAHTPQKESGDYAAAAFPSQSAVHQS